MPEIFKLARKYLKQQGLERYSVYVDTMSSLAESTLNKYLRDIGADPERTTTKDLYRLIDAAKTKVLNWISGTGVDLSYLEESRIKAAAIASVFVDHLKSPSSDKIKAFVEVNNQAGSLINEVKGHV